MYRYTCKETCYRRFTIRQPIVKTENKHIHNNYSISKYHEPNQLFGFIFIYTILTYVFMFMYSIESWDLSNESCRFVQHFSFYFCVPFFQFFLPWSHHCFRCLASIHLISFIYVLYHNHRQMIIYMRKTNKK